MTSILSTYLVLALISAVSGIIGILLLALFNKRFKAGLLDLNGLWKRFISVTPVFWKRFQAFCAGCSAMGTAAFALPKNVIEHLPHDFMKAASYLIAIGIFGIFAAQFTVKDKKEDEPGKQ